MTRRFIVRSSTAEHIVRENEANLSSTIVDRYIDKDLRVRKTTSSSEEVFYHIIDTHKAALHQIDEETYRSLSECVSLTVKKRVFVVKGGRLELYKLTLVESPLQIAYVCTTDQSVVDDYMLSKEYSGRTFDLLTRKIGIAGAPSAGKTELAKSLSSVINTKFNGTSYHVAEYATTFLQKYDRTPDMVDQLFMWIGQKERETTACGKSNIVISDCPTFLSYIYTRRLLSDGLDSRSAFVLSKIYKRVLIDILLYTDLLFVELSKYVENNIRFHSMGEADEIQGQIYRFLSEHRINFKIVTDRNAERLVDDIFCINYAN